MGGVRRFLTLHYQYRAVCIASDTFYAIEGARFGKSVMTPAFNETLRCRAIFLAPHYLWGDLDAILEIHSEHIAYQHPFGVAIFKHHAWRINCETIPAGVPYLWGSLSCGEQFGFGGNRGDWLYALINAFYDFLGTFEAHSFWRYAFFAAQYLTGGLKVYPFI